MCSCYRGQPEAIIRCANCLARSINSATLTVYSFCFWSELQVEGDLPASTPPLNLSTCLCLVFRSFHFLYFPAHPLRRGWLNYFPPIGSTLGGFSIYLFFLCCLCLGDSLIIFICLRGRPKSIFCVGQTLVAHLRT